MSSLHTHLDQSIKRKAQLLEKTRLPHKRPHISLSPTSVIVISDDPDPDCQDSNDHGEAGHNFSPGRPKQPQSQLIRPTTHTRLSPPVAKKSQFTAQDPIPDRTANAIRDADQFPHNVMEKLRACGRDALATHSSGTTVKDARLATKVSKLSQCRAELLGLMDLFQTTFLQAMESKALLQKRDAEVKRLKKALLTKEAEAESRAATMTDAAQVIAEQNQKLADLEAQLLQAQQPPPKRPYKRRKLQQIPLPPSPEKSMLETHEDDALSLAPSAVKVTTARTDPVPLPWEQRAPRHRRPFTLQLDKQGKCEVPVYYSAKASKGKIWYKTPEEHDALRNDDSVKGGTSLFQSYCTVNLIFETELGEEFHGNERCRHCELADVECWRFREDVIEQIRRPATRCARCILDGTKCTMSSHQVRAAERARERGVSLPEPTPPKKNRRRKSYKAVDLHERPDDEEYAALLAEDQAEDAAREARTAIQGPDHDDEGVAREDGDDQRLIADSASEVSE